MKVSALEIVLETDRVRQQTAVRTHAGFARPVLCEQAVGVDEGPFLASNLRGSFLPTRRSSDGNARFAFAECPIGAEDRLVVELFDVLWRTSVQHDWPNRCRSLDEAKVRMEALGMVPRAYIAAPSLLDAASDKELSGDDADKLMMFQGHVAEVDGIKILASGLPDGRGILTSIPSKTGRYVRSGDFLGVLVCRADRSMVLVGGE